MGQAPRTQSRTRRPCDESTLLGQVVAVNPLTVRCPGLVVEELVGVTDLLQRAGGNRSLVALALLSIGQELRRYRRGRRGCRGWRRAASLADSFGDGGGQLLAPHFPEERVGGIEVGRTHAA